MNEFEENQYRIIKTAYEQKDYDPVRYIYLTKIARAHSQQISEHNDQMTVEKIFNVMGYYDKLTYVRPTKLYTNYKHGFSIMYPYSRGEGADIVSEQFFSLYDFQESFDKSKDPFECDGAELGAPFLGMLLVSCEVPTDVQEKLYGNMTYDKMLRNIIREANEFKGFPNGTNILKVFLTLNCANFAVVLRTNNLQNLHRVRDYISKITVNLGKSSEDISSKDHIMLPEYSFTPFICCMLPKWDDDKYVFQNPLNCYSVKNYNCKTYVNMRFSFTDNSSFSEYVRCIEKIFELKPELKRKDELYQILGDGVLSVTLPLATQNPGELSYTDIYPWICDIKYRFITGKKDRQIEKNNFAIQQEAAIVSQSLQESPSAIIQSMENGKVSDDECIKDSQLCFNWYICKEFVDLYSFNGRRKNVLNVHERFRFKKLDDQAKKNPDVKISLANYAIDLKASIEKYITQLNKYQYWMGAYSEEYKRNLTLMKDLCYTFGDLCQLKKFAIHGHIFIIQMWILCENIEKNVNDLKEKNSFNRNELSPQNAKYICDNMKQAILAINNYSKMLQSFTQDAINNQIYEIQTKVNSEKYILAYTAFLLDLFNNYHKEMEKNLAKDKEGEEDKEGKILNIFPLVFMDIIQDRIFTKMLFSESNSDLKLFTVNFPDYRNFGDIYHVLPTIVHEISHSMRYEKRSNRNENVLEIVFKSVGKKIAQYLTIVSAQRAYYTKNRFNEFMSKQISSFLYQEFSEYFGDTWKTMRLDELKNNIADWLKIYLPNRNMVLQHKLPWYVWYPSYCEEIQILFRSINGRYLNIRQLENYASSLKQIRKSDIWDIYRDITCSIILRIMMYEKDLSLADLENENSLFLRLTKEMIKVTPVVQEEQQSKNNRSPIILKNNLFPILCKILRIEQRIIAILKKKDQKIGTVNNYKKLFSKAINFLKNFEGNEISDPIRGIGQGFLVYSLSETIKNLDIECPENNDWTIFFEDKIKIEWMLLNPDNFEKTISFLWSRVTDKEKAAQRFHELLYLCDSQTFIFQLSRLDLDYRYQEDETARIKKLRMKLHEDFKGIYDKHYLKDYDALKIASPENNQTFTYLGISLKEDTAVFDQNFRRMSDSYTDVLCENVRATVELYEELYADLGMCAAFGFSAHGYLRVLYIIHNSMKHSREKQVTETDQLQDRATLVLPVLLIHEIFKDKNSGVNEDTFKNFFSDNSSDETNRQIFDIILTKIDVLISDLINDAIFLCQSITSWSKKYSNSLKNNNSIQNIKDIKEKTEELSENLITLIDDLNEFNNKFDSIGKTIREKDFMDSLNDSYLLVDDITKILKELLKVENDIKQMLDIIRELRDVDIDVELCESIMKSEQYEYYILHLHAVYDILNCAYNTHLIAFNDIHKFIPNYMNQIIDTYHTTIYESNWAKKTREDESIKAIAYYYNWDKNNGYSDPPMVDFDNKHNTARLYENYYHHLFIYNHYCLMRDRMGKIGYTINTDTKKEIHNAPDTYLRTKSDISSWLEILMEPSSDN